MNKRISAGILSAALLCCLTACGAEAPTSTEPQSTSDPDTQQSVEFTWSVESDCAACHETQAASSSNEGYQLYAGHSQLPCMTCHTDADALYAAHAKVTADDTDGTTRLKKTEVDATACLACHANDYTPEALADSTVLTDDNGTVVNPHNPPAVEQHASIVCSDCHAMHSTAPLAETAAEKCAGCHHHGVYECGTCHA